MRTHNTKSRLASILAVSLLVGCSHHSDNALMGTWSKDNGETITFYKDGTFSLKNLGGEHWGDFTGIYTMVDTNHIQLSCIFPQSTNTQVYELSKATEALTLNKDGTFTLKHKLFSDYTGTYTMIDTNHAKLNIVIPQGTNSTVYQLSIFGGDLSLQQVGSLGIARFHHTTN